MTEEELSETIASWGTREKAVQFPHSMNVTSYLIKKMGIPRQWHQNDLIYHYTNSAGLKGILEERVFWATKSSFLNDPTEVLHAVDVVVRALRERSQGSDQEAAIATVVLEKIKAPVSDVYVSSFCQDGDLLSQWRGYGAFGEGFALGFSFPPGKAPPIQMAWLIEVLYDEQPLIDAVDEILSIFADYVAKSSRRLAIEDVVDLFPETRHVLWLAFKNPAYREEREVRLLALRPSKPEHRDKDAERFGKVFFRTSRADVIPFIKIGMSFPEEAAAAPVLPLRRIVVGPGVRFDRNKEALEQMLHDFGYHDVEIVASRVPFVP